MSVPESDAGNEIRVCYGDGEDSTFHSISDAAEHVLKITGGWTTATRHIIWQNRPLSSIGETFYIDAIRLTPDGYVSWLIEGWPRLDFPYDSEDLPSTSRPTKPSRLDGSKRLFSGNKTKD